MIKIRILVVDRTRAPFLAEGEAFYLKRLKNYAQVEWIEVKPVKMTKGRPEADVLRSEGQALLGKRAPKDYLIALDRTGRLYGSEEFAGRLEKVALNATGGITFMIGGPLGLSTEALDEADEILSLSKFTLTHEMSRTFLLEQIYRAFTILKGEKYHK
ncbi:MAG: 23S rRNA (pseudouridine(1915)-N(3))-methyltransferase RlmH [Desulfobacterota bacterium]|jgi:23S rRNA (pseudouridine1915-N3)-methyltransferase|nr:23S rRNA (pseudouridine(1915)-N(3))-methyltransferase RlmH [Thermodesulfobacteriota bacterium]